MNNNTAFAKIKVTKLNLNLESLKRTIPPKIDPSKPYLQSITRYEQFF